MHPIVPNIYYLIPILIVEGLLHRRSSNRVLKLQSRLRNVEDDGICQHGASVDTQEYNIIQFSQHDREHERFAERISV